MSGGGIGRRPTLVGRESIGSIPIDEMVSLVIGSNPVLTAISFIACFIVSSVYYRSS